MKSKAYSHLLEVLKENFSFGVPQWIIESIVAGAFTLGGAFLGAYLASRYATNQINKQLTYQRDLAREQKLSETIKYSTTMLTLLITGKDVVKDIVEELEEDRGQLTFVLYKCLDAINEYINEIDKMSPIQNLNEEMYRCIFLGLNNLKNCRDLISSIKEINDRDSTCSIKSNEYVSIDYKLLLEDLEKLNQQILEAREVLEEEKIMKKMLFKKIQDL